MAPARPGGWRAKPPTPCGRTCPSRPGSAAGGSSAATTATWKQLYLELRYEDTDLTPAQCGFTDWRQPSVIGTIRVDLPPII